MSFFVASAIFGDAGVSLFVAGAQCHVSWQVQYLVLFAMRGLSEHSHFRGTRAIFGDVGLLMLSALYILDISCAATIKQTIVLCSRE